jgi:nitrogen regulatory protein P-II 1
MKKIEAIIRQEKLERVKMLLATLGYRRITIAEVSLGSQGENSSKGSIKEEGLGYFPKLKIELVINNEDVSPVLSAIVRGAKTGDMGDGDIFIIPIEDVIRVRTGDSRINAV